MATGTVQSFLVPNYSGLLYNKANTNTPFLNSISGRVKYTQSVKFVCGQYYTSEEGDIPAISETASLTAPTATYVTRTQVYNVTQIFHETIGISYAKESNMNTLSGVNIAGQVANPINELDFQTSQKMDKIKRSIEKAFIQGTYNEANSDATINKTRGMLAAITTNVVSAQSGSGQSVTNAPLDLWLVNDAVKKIKESGGEIDNLIMLVNATNLLQLHGNAVELGMKVGEPYMNTFGIQVRDVLLPIGAVVRVGLGEFLPDGTALIYNPRVCGPVEQPVPGKGNFFREELAKTGAGEQYQIFGQIGLDHGPEWYHAKITGLSTTFTKPAGLAVKTVSA